MIQEISQIEIGDKDECAICLAEGRQIEIKTVTLCGHMFCYPCITLWLKNGIEKLCPLCRQTPLPLRMSFKNRCIIELKQMVKDGFKTTSLAIVGWAVSESFMQTENRRHMSGWGLAASGIGIAARIIDAGLYEISDREINAKVETFVCFGTFFGAASTYFTGIYLDLQRHNLEGSLKLVGSGMTVGFVGVGAAVGAAMGTIAIKGGCGVKVKEFITLILGVGICMANFIKPVTTVLAVIEVAAGVFGMALIRRCQFA